MSDEQIKQRISYLVEHGGLWDDPLEDLRRTLRRALALGSSALVLTLIDIATDLI